MGFNPSMQRLLDVQFNREKEKTDYLEPQIIEKQ